jgi:hypothetical protein
MQTSPRRELLTLLAIIVLVLAFVASTEAGRWAPAAGALVGSATGMVLRWRFKRAEPPHGQPGGS